MRGGTLRANSQRARKITRARARAESLWLPSSTRPAECRGRVQGSGSRAQGLGFRVQGSEFRVQGPGFRVQDLGLRVLGAGCFELRVCRV
jgi:hypothetical protein